MYLVTAYARRNLFTGILEFQKDYIYSDTDSIKCINYENHIDYVNKYNEDIIRKLEKACKFHGLPLEMIRPKTKDGIEKPLGVWDFENVYKRFKTLGAKRYMIEDENGLNITVSGLNKKVTTPWLIEKYNNPFEAFEDGLQVPEEYTGKNIHTYIEIERQGTITDYLGNEDIYHELTGVHLEACPYSLSLSQEYIEYILGCWECDK